MPVPSNLQAHIENGDFEALEDAWLKLLATDPADVEPFAATARALAGVDEDERARFLLELVDGELTERAMWDSRLDLLRHAGSLLLDPEQVHPEIVSTLARLHADRPSHTEMAEAVGLHRATHDLPKTWEKVDRLHVLLSYDVGTIVAMQGRGVGTVCEANFQLESFRVEFPDHKPLHVGFRAAAKMLEPLAPGHLLRRKLEEPEEVARLSREDPSELLRVALVSRGRPLTAGEIRQDLSGVVEDGRWSSFWNAARKHPQVVVAGKGRQTYAWAETSGDAHEAVWQAFAAAPPRRKLDLFRREAAREPQLVDRMSSELARMGRAAAAGDPGLAFEVWFALDRAGRAAEAPELAPAELLAGTRSRAELLLSTVEDKVVRERAYQAAREVREDWRELFMERLEREDEPRSLDRMLDELRAASPDDEGLPREVARFLDGLLAQPHRQPAAFVWLAERAKDDAALRQRNPLRLLQQILTALARDEFATWRVRLRALSETGGTLPRLLPGLEPSQAEAAKDAIHRSPGLEAYERDNLQQALELRFPALRGEDSASAVLYALPASIATKRAELDKITREELPANRKAIEEARAMGDLRENFEYKSARQRHEYLSALATELDHDLRRARPIDFAQIDSTQVRLGTRVRLSAAGSERTLTLLGPWESDPDQGVISYETDLAQLLLGKQVGDMVEVEGGPATIEQIEVAAG